MPSKAATSKAKPKTDPNKVGEAIRTIWFDSRKRPKGYVDRFAVPSEGE